jgi:PKD repeat protein
MNKFWQKASAALVLSLWIGVAGAWASGKMQVKIGDRVDLSAESVNPSATFKWVVKRGDEILSTQTLRNFSYQFPTQGDYTVNLTATSGQSVENTSIDVMAGDLYSSTVNPAGGTSTGTSGESLPAGVTPLNLVLDTLPPMNADKTVHLLGDEGKVTFNLSSSTGDIVEYRIDKNIFLDSDGNGVANDDIDNANDPSYLTGTPWSADYKSGESPTIVAEITLVDKTGRKAKQQVQIVFDPLNNTGDPVAVLDVSPAPDPKDNLVHLYDDPHKVAFYSRNSTGKILEYRIDKDIFTDSDGDGDPADDIDNLHDPSFKTGDVWVTDYAKTDKQIIAQLTVVGENGKGSRVQKGLVFGDKPVPPAPTSTETPTGIQLTADKDFVIKGDPITFTVKGLDQSLDQYSFSWDLNGDGSNLQQTDGVNTFQNIYDTPGAYTVKVTITDKQGNTTDKTLDIVVKDTVVTKADFSFTVDGNTVQFKDLSTAAFNLSDKRLDYQWSFGDTDQAGFEKQKDQVGAQEPTYTYAKAGKYIVTLTVTDINKVIDSKSAEVEIKQDLPVAQENAPATGTTPNAPATETPTGGGGSLVLKIVKALLYLVLILVALVVLVVGGFLAFLKVKNPTMTFEELVEEFKRKILSVMGVHDLEEGGLPSSEELPKPPSRQAETTEEPASAEPAPTKPETSAGGQKREVIEGEVEEDKKDDDDKTPPPPVGEQGPTPDWLKNIK